MTCPHCNKSITYKQRGGRKCGECRRAFAFEPKVHPMALHDVRFRKTVRKLSDGGKLRYTAEQLRHALARKPVAAQKRADAGCIVAPFVVAAVGLGGLVAQTIAPAVGYILAAAIGVVGVFVYKRSRRRPFHPKLPMSAEKFRTEVLDRWQEVYGERPEGLLDPRSLTAPPADAPAVEKLDAVVVSPERDVLLCLLANGVAKQLDVGLLPVAPPFDAWQQAVLERLRKDPDLPVLLLHDASAAGAFLARDLLLLLRLDPRHRIYDLGLNPRRSVLKKRLVVGAPLPDALGARLDTELAEVSGRVRPIRRGRARLTPDEISWLAEGYSSPLLAISPASLSKRIRFALDKIESKHHPHRDARAEAAARAVGFLTWPA
jgi:hypothetical protein